MHTGISPFHMANLSFLVAAKLNINEMKARQTNVLRLIFSFDFFSISSSSHGWQWKFALHFIFSVILIQLRFVFFLRQVFMLRNLSLHAKTCESMCTKHVTILSNFIILSNASQCSLSENRDYRWLSFQKRRISSRIFNRI